MKYFQIVCLLIFIITCSEKRTANDKFWDWFKYCTMGFGSSTTYGKIVEDRGDGTLEVMGTQDMTFCFQYKTQHKYSTQNFIKKCIQGQVYRKEQNDCKGKGTQADWWGAEKFQWCPTNDRACETKNSSGFYYVSDYTKVPAFATCRNDNIAGQNWNLNISLYFDNHLAYYNYVVKNRLDEIPIGDSYYYWRLGSASEEKAPAFQLGKILKFGDGIEILKNSFQYVLCESKKGA